MRLTPETEAAGYRLIVLDSTGSTNDDALKAAREGDAGKLWIVAREQQAGRGRHGRAWVSPPGNLYASLLLVDPCDPARAPQLGFVAGLALHEAVEQVTGMGAPDLALKWPNDLLVRGAKVSGLLLEGHRLACGSLAIVIGFGINVATAPAQTPYPATTLQTVHPGVTREALFPALAAAFMGALCAWAGQPERFAAIRRLWLERAAGLGSPVTVRLPSGERRGMFQGLDEHGRLQLTTEAGSELIDAGDLYFPNFDSTSASSSSVSARS